MKCSKCDYELEDYEGIPGGSGFFLSALPLIILCKTCYERYLDYQSTKRKHIVNWHSLSAVVQLVVMMSIRGKKIYYNKLLAILHKADAFVIELDAEIGKTMPFENASIILGGLTATIPMLLRGMERDIIDDEMSKRFDQELSLLMDEEQKKWKELPTIKPVITPNEEDIDGGHLV